MEVSKKILLLALGVDNVCIIFLSTDSGTVYILSLIHIFAMATPSSIGSVSVKSCFSSSAQTAGQLSFTGRTDAGITKDVYKRQRY